MYKKSGYLSWNGKLLYEILDENNNVVIDGLSLSIANRILIVLNGES